jgi:hypothetical protein
LAISSGWADLPEKKENKYKFSVNIFEVQNRGRMKNTGKYMK